MVQSTTTSNCTSRLPYRHILWIILLPAVMAISDYDITIPSFLYAASTDYFDHPLDELTRWKMVLRAVLYLQGGVIILDFLLCVFLNHWFKHVNTTTDQHRDTRDSRPWYTLSLMTSDYPGRWFLLHGCWNVFITIACLPDVVRTFRNPTEACRSDIAYNLMPTLMSMALHLYHCAAPWFWSKLTKEDIFHHIVFAIGGLGSISVLWSWGPSASFGLIYLTGFPGGLDYFMLGLTKMGVMDRLQEKSVNASVNAWIRGPGCTICAAWFWAAWRAGKMEVPTIAILVNIVLTFYNGNYYSQRVVANESRCRTLEDVRNSPTIGGDPVEKLEPPPIKLE